MIGSVDFLNLTLKHLLSAPSLPIATSRVLWNSDNSLITTIQLTKLMPIHGVRIINWLDEKAGRDLPKPAKTS